MGATNTMLAAYFLVQAIIVWQISARMKPGAAKLLALATAVFLTPLLMLLQDGSNLADGGGVRNVIAFFWVAGGIIIAGATLWLQRLRYRADRQ